jgi:prevent-host-death family protein
MTFRTEAGHNGHVSTTVSTRELRTRLARYLRLVRAGKTLVVTDRGRPIAELRPVQRGGDDEEEILRELAALGKVTLASGEPFPPLDPVRLRGAALSATIVEDRQDRR